MKLSTFNNRTSDLSHGSKGYQIALSLLEGSKIVRTCWTSGSKRFCKNMDYTSDVINALEIAGLKKGIDFSLENDSPRGGLTGNYITLTAKGKSKMIK